VHTQVSSGATAQYEQVGKSSLYLRSCRQSIVLEYTRFTGTNEPDVPGRRRVNLGGTRRARLSWSVMPGVIAITHGRNALEIVGVVKNAHYGGVRRADTEGTMYVPSWTDGAEARWLVLRVAGGAPPSH